MAERWIALLGGGPVDFATREHPAWSKMPERFTHVEAGLRPAARAPARLDALFAMLEDAARDDGTQNVTAWAWEHDLLMIDVLQARGFRQERRERFWQLDHRWS